MPEQIVAQHIEAVIAPKERAAVIVIAEDGQQFVFRIPNHQLKSMAALAMLELGLLAHLKDQQTGSR
jgi:hypothetical protein